MMYKKSYKSPLGPIVITSDGKYLTGLWFEKTKDDYKHDKNLKEKDLNIFDELLDGLIFILVEQILNLFPSIKFKI